MARRTSSWHEMREWESYVYVCVCVCIWVCLRSWELKSTLYS